MTYFQDIYQDMLAKISQEPLLSQSNFFEFPALPIFKIRTNRAEDLAKAKDRSKVTKLFIHF